ncbi:MULTISPECIES: cyclic peptide export ABC transporter [Methylomonas]|uniref:cyclic peptide export ABC transporter n=1 Tax=Methylomonas TaxID=416 RepID=UPI001231E0AA|nr:cyclic peptide export ABC transporter [Methylomonas rhizoryzae]
MWTFLWRSSPLTLLFVMLTGIVSGLSNAGLIAFINGVLAGKSEVFFGHAGFAGLVAVVLLSRFASHYGLNRFSTRLVKNLRLRIAGLILQAPYPVLQTIGKPALLSHLTEDVVSIAGASELFPVICINFAIVAGCMSYLTWLSWQLAAVLASAIGFGVLSFGVCNRFSQCRLRAAREEYDGLSRGFSGLTEGVRELKLHRRRAQGFMSGALEAHAEGYRRHSLAAIGHFLLINQWIQLLYYLTIAAILFVFPHWQALNTEVVGGYVLVFLFMMSPLTVLTNSIPTFARAKVALQKVTALERSLAQSCSSISAGMPQQPEFEHLILSGVTHQFHREKENRSFTLGPIDLTIRPGELIFLVGGNGSGKTTLAMLLMGLYHPEQGGVFWNGTRVDAGNRDAYMQNFSVIFADFHLFDELYGIDSQPHQAFIADYLERLQLNHKVEIANGRFSSVNLSQGQRKRLALLTAYLEDRPIYIFDEWAADQDPEFKQIFYTELLPALKARGKTVVAITHDDKYFRLADRCIKLEDGQIAAIEYPQVPDERAIQPVDPALGAWSEITPLNS